MNKDFKNLSEIQNKLKKNHLILIEFVYDLSIIVTKENIYLTSWEEGDYILKKGLLQLMDKKQKENRKSLKYWRIEEDKKERYEILDHIFKTCKYTTVEYW